MVHYDVKEGFVHVLQKYCVVQGGVRKEVFVTWDGLIPQPRHLRCMRRELGNNFTIFSKQISE